MKNNLNLDNETNSNKRDYDKDPLILKDYTEFFIFLNFSSFFEEYGYGNINLIFLFVNILLFIVFLFIDIFLFIFLIQLIVL